MRTLYFLTGNKNKLAEAQAILPGVQGLDVDLPEVQSLDPQRVVTAKLDEARLLRRVGRGDSLIVEDTSLTLDCMNGMPGPLIKWFLEAKGLGWLHLIASAAGDFAATARTVIGYSDGRYRYALKYFEGAVRGKIVLPRGETRFGWDPIFVPDGQLGMTFAEMTAEQKNAISMRRKAFEALKVHLDAQR